MNAIDISDIPYSHQWIIDIPDDEQPKPPEPPVRRYDSSDVGKKDLQDFAAAHGYALVTIRSDKTQGKFIFACSRWPNPTKDTVGPVGDGTKTREQNKLGTNCPFRVQLRLRRPRGQHEPTPSSDEKQVWEVRVPCGNHNHGPTPKHLLVILRQRERKEKEKRLIGYFTEGLKTIQIWLILKAEKSLLSLNDLRNLRARARRMFLNGYTPIEAVIKRLPGWFIYYQLDSNRRPTRIFFISKTGLMLLRVHPTMLWIDATYKTNRYNMPLINIVGQVSTRKNFTLGLCFVNNEQEESYSWTLKTLNTQLNSMGIPVPRVIFSDDSDSLLNACGQQFKETRGLLCLWHIMKNIETRVRPMISKQLLLINPKKDVQTEVMDQWRSTKASFMQIVLASTEDQMEEKKTVFLKDLSNPIFQTAVDYIKKQWFTPERAQRFMRCYLNSVPHLDELTSSRVEGAHAKIKHELRSSRGDILATMQSISRTTLYTNTIAFRSIQAAMCRKPISLNYSLFRDVLGRVSTVAIRKVHDNWTEHLRNKEPPLPPCTGYQSRSLGIPCLHQIKDLVQRGEPLIRSHFHEQYWLRLPNLRIIPIQQQWQQRLKYRVKEPGHVRGIGRPKLLETVKRFPRWAPRDIARRAASARRKRGTYQTMDKAVGIVMPPLTTDVPTLSKTSNTSTKRVASNWEKKLRQGRGARGRIAKIVATKEAEMRVNGRAGSSRRFGIKSVGSNRWRRGWRKHGTI